MKWPCVVLMVVVFFCTGCKKKSIDELLQQGRVDVAQKYCGNLENEAQKECFAKIAVYYFQLEDFKKAAEFYAKAGDHVRVISCYLIGDSLPDAEAYCAKLPASSRKEGASLLAKSCYLRGNYTAAMRYYQMAGEMQKAEQIRAKVPAFQLLEALQANATKYARSEIRSKIETVHETLKTYLYLDGYDTWRFGSKNETDRAAALIFAKAHHVLQQSVAPVFIENITKTLATSSWTTESVAVIFFHRARMNRLIRVLKALDTIGSYRRFYSNYAGMSQITPEKGEPGYEVVYKSAVHHAAGLMETIAQSEKGVKASLFADFSNDMDVDGEVVDYIADMLDNIQARLMELETRGKHIQKVSTDQMIKSEISGGFVNFVSACNLVLLEIGKKEYRNANEMLLKTYNAAKKKITDIEKLLNIPEDSQRVTAFK